MIRADLDGGLIVLSSDHEFRDRERVKQLPGARFSGGRWTMPLTWASAQQLRGVFGQELLVGPELALWSQDLARERIWPALALREAVELPDGEWGPIMDWRREERRLYPFQEAGVAFLATAGRAFLADEMGAGKTVQVARTLRLLAEQGRDPFPAVVVAPVVMLETWRRELEAWGPEGVRVVVVRGSAAQRRRLIEGEADVWVIGLQALRYHTRLAPYGGVRLKRCVECDPTLADTPENQRSRCEHCRKEMNERAWRTVVLDEAHRVKEPKAKQTRAVWALATEATEFVYCLSGTPVVNAPHDLWSSLHLIEPESFSNRSKYIERYCETSYNPFGGVTVNGLNRANREEFFKILDPCFRRMQKEVVLPNLPRKVYDVRVVDLTPKQQRAYDQVKKGMLAQIDKGTLVAGDALVQVTRLSQLANAYLEGDGEQARMVEPSNKVDALMDLLEDMGDQPLVAFAQSRQLIGLAERALERAGVPYGLIVGGQPESERELAMRRFQAGDLRVMLGTVQAGGVGVTLTRAGVLVFLQRSWSMVDNLQAEDRVHRIGSEAHDKIVIVDLVSRGTIEEQQRNVLGRKAARLEEVIRDQESLRRLLTGEGAL